MTQKHERLQYTRPEYDGKTEEEGLILLKRSKESFKEEEMFKVALVNQ